MLALIVGPSGAGKDTLLNASRATLDRDHRFRFIQRTITRAPEPGGEDNQQVDERSFLALRDAGNYALWWRAHGLFYGVPADIALDLAERRVAVASVSRTVLAEAATRFPVRVIEVTAPPALLARRLAARGREDAVAVAQRLSRSVPLPAGLAKESVVNDGTIEQGARRMVAVLTRLADEVSLAAPAARR